MWFFAGTAIQNMLANNPALGQAILIKKENLRKEFLHRDKYPRIGGQKKWWKIPSKSLAFLEQWFLEHIDVRRFCFCSDFEEKNSNTEEFSF